jgi:CRISPR-associated protein Csy1
VRATVQTLRRFLRDTEHNNLAIRKRRAQLVAGICDEAIAYAGELRTLDAGWTAAPNCRLNEEEALWLDPDRTAFDEAFAERYRRRDWPEQVSTRFASWLNQSIQSQGKVFGDDEHAQWTSMLRREIEMFRDYLGETRDNA